MISQLLSIFFAKRIHSFLTMFCHNAGSMSTSEDPEARWERAMDIGDMDYLGYGHRTVPVRAPPGLFNFNPGALDLLDDLSDDDDDVSEHSLSDDID